MFNFRICPNHDSKIAYVFQHHIITTTSLHSVWVFNLTIMTTIFIPGTRVRVPTLIYSRRDCRPSAIRRHEHVFLCRLSLDQHRTAFSSLYETRTHPFGVAAIRTDLSIRNYYTLLYRLLLSQELSAELTTCQPLELWYSFGLIIGLASRRCLHISAE